MDDVENIDGASAVAKHDDVVSVNEAAAILTEVGPWSPDLAGQHRELSALVAQRRDEAYGSVRLAELLAEIDRDFTE